MTNLGADLQDVLTIQDLMGFTPTDYVTGQHQVGGVANFKAVHEVVQRVLKIQPNVVPSHSGRPSRHRSRAASV